MSKSCSTCDADNRDQAKFCRQCGTAFYPEQMGKIIEANTIIIRDKSDKVRALLGVVEGTVALMLMDEQGVERITVKVGAGFFRESRRRWDQRCGGHLGRRRNASRHCRVRGGGRVSHAADPAVV